MGVSTSCHEVALAAATCHIEIADVAGPAGLAGYAAHVFELDNDRARHQLVSTDGHPIELRGRSESAVLSTAVAYLAERYGGLSEYAHECKHFPPRPADGAPIVVRDSGESLSTPTA